MSTIAAPSPAPVASPRRAWLADLPVLLVAVVWGGSYLAAKGVTTTHTVIAVRVLRLALVQPVQEA
ncbi:EamA family transporter, partial [Streptomyces sp. NPDC059956]